MKPTIKFIAYLTRYWNKINANPIDLRWERLPWTGMLVQLSLMIFRQSLSKNAPGSLFSTHQKSDPCGQEYQLHLPQGFILSALKRYACLQPVQMYKLITKPHEHKITLKTENIIYSQEIKTLFSFHVRKWTTSSFKDSSYSPEWIMFLSKWLGLCQPLGEHRNNRLTHQIRQLEIRNGWATQTYIGQTLYKILYSISWTFLK